MYRLYELPADAPASAETRRRYAEFAQWCYERFDELAEQGYDVYVEKHNTNTLRDAEYNLATPRTTYTSGDLHYTRSTTSIYKGVRLNSHRMPNAVVLGAYIPNDVPVYSTYTKYGGVYCEQNSEDISIQQQVLPLESVLQSARDVESTGCIAGYKYIPIRFPFVSDNIYYNIETLGTHDIYFMCTTAQIFYNHFVIADMIFYNPIQNIMENYYGARIT
jgi:hypothetical protein